MNTIIFQLIPTFRS